MSSAERRRLVEFQYPSYLCFIVYFCTVLALHTTHHSLQRFLFCLQVALNSQKPPSLYNSPTATLYQYQSLQCKTRHLGSNLVGDKKTKIKKIKNNRPEPSLHPPHIIPPKCANQLTYLPTSNPTNSCNTNTSNPQAVKYCELLTGAIIP